MTDKKNIPALTGIRAVCVYFIFFKHLNFFSAATHPDLYLLVNQFYTFLTFFFVLSGFLIYHRYHEISGLDKKKLHNYFINRIARVFPILIILVSITFFLDYYHGIYSAKETLHLYFINVLLIKGFSSNYFLTGIGPSWSMSVEELFYLLSPVLFLYGKNFSNLARLVILFYVLGILITFAFSVYPFDGFFSSYIFTASGTFFGRVFEFACGIFLGFLVSGKYPNFIIHKLGKSTLYFGLFIIMLSIFLLFSIASYYQLPHATDVWPGIVVNNILMPVGILLLFYSLVYHKSMLQYFLGSKIMVQLGNATYSFYLLHTTFVLSYIFKFISTNIFIAFVCMILVSLIFHKLVEQPLAVFVRKKLSLK